MTSPAAVPPASCPALVVRDRRFDADHPGVMAIINRTPDSFFEGNRHVDFDEAMRAVDAAVAEGADIVDVGGVRAGQEGQWVGVDEEIERVVPFIAAVRARHPAVIISSDTWRAPVAREAVAAGADILNDTWAGYDAKLAEVAAEFGVAVVCSHSGGLPPRTDPVSVTYSPEPDGVVADVVDTLRRGAQRCLSLGIPRERILVDPTLDFGKTTDHSLTLLRHTEQVVALGFPVMQAMSRKDFVGEVLGLPALERLEGSIAAAAIAVWLGVGVFRVHDVRATKRALTMAAAIRGLAHPGVRRRGVPQE